MDDRLKALIQHLGGTLGEPGPARRFIASAHFSCSRRGDSWQGQDPLGQLRDVAPTIRAFGAVKWPAGPFFIDDFGLDKWTTVELYGASENSEVFDKDGARRLLYQIGTTDVQFTYAFDLLDQSPDPAVYRFDSESAQETFSREFPRLSLFLASLKTDATVAASKISGEWEKLFRAALAAGRGTEAIEVCKQALEQHPANPDFLMYVANVSLIAGDERKAEDLYRQALEIKPNHVHTLGNLGLLLARRGQMEEAETLLKHAVACFPTFAPAHGNLARGYGAAGRKAEMLAALKQAIALDPAGGRTLLDEKEFAAFRKDRDVVALSKKSRRRP